MIIKLSSEDRDVDFIMPTPTPKRIFFQQYDFTLDEIVIGNEEEVHVIAVNKENLTDEEYRTKFTIYQIEKYDNQSIDIYRIYLKISVDYEWSRCTNHYYCVVNLEEFWYFYKGLLGWSSLITLKQETTHWDNPPYKLDMDMVIDKLIEAYPAK